MGVVCVLELMPTGVTDGHRDNCMLRQEKAWQTMLTTGQARSSGSAALLPLGPSPAAASLLGEVTPDPRTGGCPVSRRPP